MIKLEIFVEEERAKQILESGEEVTIMMRSHFNNLLAQLDKIFDLIPHQTPAAESTAKLIKELREGNVNSPE